MCELRDACPALSIFIKYLSMLVTLHRTFHDSNP